MSTGLAIIEQDQSLAEVDQHLSAELRLAPAFTVEAAVEHQQQLQQIVGRLLVPCTDMRNFDGADYGLLPGTYTRALFQPGAEKLALFFGLEVDLSRQQATEDWDKGFFFYRYKAIVRRKGHEMCNIERSCHTREDKYAWVWVETSKPGNKDLEEQMKAEKIGRNRKATKWENGRKTEAWVWQERRPNPDTFSLQFVVEAMAQKRAYVAAVKKALGATGFFSREVDQEAFRDEVAIEPEHPIKLIGAQPTPEKPIKSKSKTETRTDQDADWSTQFWARANSAGVKREDALPLADQANRGEITWEEAIKSLPN